MSTPSIAPDLPFGRVRVVGQRTRTDPSTASVELVADRRFTPRCNWCEAGADRIHSRYCRWIRNLSLGEHETWLWLEVRRLRCSDCQAIRAEGFEFVAPYARVTKRMAHYIAELCRMLSVAEVARHLGPAAAGGRRDLAQEGLPLHDRGPGLRDGPGGLDG